MNKYFERFRYRIWDTWNSLMCAVFVLDPKKFRERKVAKTMGSLSYAIEKRDPIRICECSRSLVWKAIYAYSYPELWTDDHVREAVALLDRAAEATVGTSKEKKCAPRAEMFQKEIQNMRQARQSLDSICGTRA